MGTVSYHRINPNDKELIKIIAEWYLSEWNIPIETTTHKLNSFPDTGIPFQLIMQVDGIPVSTGGIYNHVSLLDRAPQYKIYQPWLALIYTSKKNRNKGYGALLCEKIQESAKESGLKEIFLYTHTAEALYKRLHWKEIERIFLNDKDIVVMKRNL